jgi:hypothetical protein
MCSGHKVVSVSITTRAPKIDFLKTSGEEEEDAEEEVWRS